MRPHIYGLVALLVWIALSAAGPSRAADADLSTPEGAIAAYIDGVARRDMNAVIAASSADEMSEHYDFAASVDSNQMLHVTMPMPTGDPIFVEINRMGFVAQVGFQVKLLAYGLMTNNGILDGTGQKMDVGEATDLASAVRADRLSDLKLVEVIIPKPEMLNRKSVQKSFVRKAGIYGADELTERVAAVSFEGQTYGIGFGLLRYGGSWGIMSQTSNVAGLDMMGVPRRLSLEELKTLME